MKKNFGIVLIKFIFECNKLPKGDLQLGLGFTKETLHNYDGEPIPEYTIFISFSNGIFILELELNMMKIDLKDIIKIQHLEMEIFEEEDNDYVDYRIVKNKEKQFIEDWLKLSLVKKNKKK